MKYVYDSNYDILLKLEVEGLRKNAVELMELSTESYSDRKIPTLR